MLFLRRVSDACGAMPKRKRARSQKPKALPPANKEAETEAKRGRGRPSILENVNISLLLDELAVGTPPTAAAPLAGMSRSTYYSVLKAGRRLERQGKRGSYREFLDKVRVARAKGETHFSHILARGAAGDPGASRVQECPHCHKEIELEVPRPPRPPNTSDAIFMLKALNPKVWNVDKAPGASSEKPISRLELIGAFSQMGQAVGQEVEDVNARRRIGDRWREIYRTLGLDEDKAQIVDRRQTTLDQKRLPNGSDNGT
jgi:hypothetical protein